MALDRLLNRYKPAASARTHVLLGAAMWTAVGAALAIAGSCWTLAGATSFGWLLILAAAAAGVIKSRFVLDRSAERALRRIHERGDMRCVGGFFSPKAWGFVVAMAVVGRVLRDGLLPRHVVGPLYVAVGTALLLAARKLWIGWARFDRLVEAGGSS